MADTNIYTGGGAMKKIKLTILIMALVFIIALLITYISVNNIVPLKERLEASMGEVEALERKLGIKEFHYTTAKMEIDNLEQVIESKDELIWSLQAEVVVATDRSELDRGILEYCLAYIQYMQVLAYSEGIAYPEFIVDSVLNDNYFEELKDQVEYFEGMGE